MLSGPSSEFFTALLVNFIIVLINPTISVCFFFYNFCLFIDALYLVRYYSHASL